MKLRELFLFLLVLVLMPSCARYPTIPTFEQTGNPATAQQGHPQGKDSNYEIGPDDLLLIQVWDHPDLERKVYVSRNGTFSYPFIGEVQAVGLSVEKVEQEITRRLGEGYIVDPQVTVTVNEPKVKYFYVFGEVKTPGRYEWDRGVTVLKAIATAGGLTEKAAVRKTKVVREQEGGQVRVKVRITDPVLPGDTIVVPESFF